MSKYHAQPTTRQGIRIIQGRRNQKNEELEETKMIKANVSREGVSLAANGTLAEILADSSRMINAVYTTLRRNNPDVAEVYKAVMQGAVNDPESPIWQANEQDGVVVDMAELKRQMDEQ